MTFEAGAKIKISGSGIDEIVGSIGFVVKDLGNDVYQVKVKVEDGREVHNIGVENLEKVR
ncbi:MAG: hypothetical protein ABEK59_08250 [Halobacteria archaeon]